MASNRWRPCPSCRALYDASSGACTYCGASAEQRARPVRIGTEEGDGAWRHFPVTAFFTALLIGIYAAQIALQVTLYGEIPEMRGLFDFLAPSSRAHALVCGLPLGPNQSWFEGGWVYLLSNFSHAGGALHLGLNLSAFALLGRRVEAHLGSAFSLLLVFVGCFSLAIAPLLQAGQHLGFSGVVCAFLGAALVHARATSDTHFTSYAVHWTITLAIWSLLPVVSWAGHLAGFVLGALLVGLWLAVPERFRRQRSARVALAGISATALLACALLQAREAIPAVRYRKFPLLDDLVIRVHEDLATSIPDRAWAAALHRDLEALGPLPGAWEEVASALLRGASEMSSVDRTQAERRAIGQKMLIETEPWFERSASYDRKLYVELQVDDLSRARVRS
ncbi:MAG: rhomboid family intramembrane serine protease [Planctomycetes bacterium]|nr:rhomboid family intramembrane serine protease [Planctomycetota bacterium]